jgi:hypothetical protein
MKIKMNNNQEMLLEIAVGLSIVVTVLLLIVGAIEIFKK